MNSPGGDLANCANLAVVLEMTGISLYLGWEAFFALLLCIYHMKYALDILYNGLKKVFKHFGSK